MEVRLSGTGEDCSGIALSDFDEYKIPAPPQGFFEDSEKNQVVFNFTDSEEAVKYAIHLDDVYDRMGESKNYECSRKKIREIIKAINEQADFKSITFD